MDQEWQFSHAIARFSNQMEPSCRFELALGLINQTLDQYLAEQEGDYDGETRWALSWFEQYGYEEGPYGIAETLSKAKNISVQGLSEAGILEARSGKVRLLRREDLLPTWNPKTDTRITAWEIVQYLVLKLDKEGEQPAASLLKQLGSDGDAARDLAYRLYNYCERKKWSQDALAYNMLVVAWPRLKEIAVTNPDRHSRPVTLRNGDLCQMKLVE